MRDTDKLHVNHNDVVYSQEDAAALARAFDDAARKLGDFHGKIRSEGMHAAQEFRGRYATLFVLNYGQCMDDAHRLADACHRAAEAVRKIARAAEAEQDNRRRARQAELSRDTARSVNGDKAAAFGAHEKRDPFRPAYQAQPGPEIEVNPGVSPNANTKPTLGRLGEVPHEPAPPASIAEPKSSNSEKYAEGLASSGGTSSADPDALEKYTNFVLNTLNIEMNAAFTAVSNAYDTYLKTCQWGVLIIDTLLLSTQNWILDNDNDAAWINAVAQAFRNAGAGVKFTVSDAALASSIQQAGVNPGRKWLEVADVQVFGTQISSGYANDPVNVATGNFIEEERDLSVGSVSLVRMYNSIAAAGAASTHEGYAAPVGAFGPGWSSTVDTHLGFTASGVVWADVDGRQVFFARAGAGFARAAGEAWWLHRYTVNPADSSASQASDSENGATHDEANDGVCVQAARAGFAAVISLAAEHSDQVVSDGEFYGEFYAVSNNTGQYHYYTRGGAWLGSWGSEPGSAVAAIYEDAFNGGSSSRVRAMVGAFGKAIRLSYDDVSGRAVAVTGAGSRVEYAYSETGHLVEVTTYALASQSASDPVDEPESAVKGGTAAACGVMVASRVYTHTEDGLVQTVTGTGGVREVTNVYGDPDNPGRVTQQVSEHGRVIDYTYLPGGITQITTGTHENTLAADSDGSDAADTVERALHPNTWVSDSKGRLVSVTSAEGSTVRFIYDAFGNRIQVTDLEGSRTVRSANTRGLVVKELASTGSMSITEYDNLDRPVHKRTYGSKDEWIRKDAPVKVISYEYAEEGFSRQPVAVTTDGATSRYTYTSTGQMSSVTDPTGVVTRLSYDARGNLTGVLNAVGDMLKVEYDAQDRPVAVISPSGATMRVEYNVTSRPVRVIDPAGNATVYTYTPAGKVASITDAVGGVRRFEYNAAGELVAQVAPDGARTVREINELGYTVAETDPLGHVTKFVHDGMGRVTEKIDPAGNVWASRYNAADTLVEHTDPTGVLTRVSRDSAAGEITHQDGVGNTATVGFDALGRVMSSIDPSGAVTSWAYQFLTNTTAASAGEGDREPAHRQGASEPVRVQDPTENLVRVPGAHALRMCTDAAGQVSGEVCDAAGRVLRQVSASGAVTEYSYDACGRVASVTDADGVMTEYRYDADSRLVAKTRAGVVVESFVYDLCGRVLERRAGTKLVGRYAYDAAGRVVRCVDAAWGTRSFSYDACGRVVKAVSGVGGICFFDYDGAGRLLARRVATSEGFATTSYAYDAVGNVMSVTDPFGAVTKYAYDGAHRCTEVINPDGSRVSYAYDGAGEVASMHVAKPGERLGRLACAWVRDRAGRCLTVKDYLAGENLARLGAQRSVAATVATVKTTVGSANASATTTAGRSSIGVLDGAESEADVYVQTTYVSDALGRLVRVDSAPKLGDEVSDTAFFAADNRVSAAGDASAAEVFASTGAWSLAYSYDADGNVVQRTTPYGSTVYGYSPGGRIRSTQQVPAGVGVEDSSSAGDKPGVAEFAYDALGYLERVQVGECVSSWVRDTSGAVMGYTEEVLGGADEPSGSSSGVVQGVRVRRNPAGKITRVEDTVKGSWCEYAYDASGRLIRAVSSDDVSVVWVYDPVGLLMREETHQEGSLVRVRAFSYAGERVQTVRLYEALEDGGSSVAPVAGVVEDLAGLDASSLVCTGSIQYSYDVRGFRTGAVDHAGSAVRWGWDALGSLELVERINHTPESLLGSHVAAGGEDSLTGNSAVCFAASSVRNMPVAVGSQQDGQGAVVSPLIWDTTVPDAASLVGVGVTEAVSAGSVLGGRDSILTDTGAGAYGFGTDIFGVASPVTWGSNTTAAAGNGLPGLPADAGLTAQGALATVGGELMGARLYDPVTAGFLSPDPMEPVAGAGYMGASYLFASGDPVNLHDPTGLQPIPAEAMRKYTEYIESDDFIRDFDRAMAEETKRHWDGFWSVDGWKKSLEELQKDPGRWFNDHGKDVLAGVVFVGGLLLMIPQATRGVGGTIVTSMLFSAVLQKWEYGDLNPDQLTLDGLLGGITAAAVVLYLQRLERLQSMSGMTLRLEATQLSVNAPRLASKGPKKFGFQDFFAGGFFKSQEAAPLTGLYRDGAEGARTVNELRRLRYPKVEIEVKPVAGGARSATEVPPVAVSRVDVPQVAPVEGSGASRGASQVPVKPVEAPQVGEVPPASGAGSGAAGMQAVKPGGVADDAVAARGSAGGVREPEVQLKPVEEPKVENLPPAKGAGAAEGQTVSMRDVQTHLDEKLEGVRRKEWRGKDKKGRPRTDYYDYNEFIAKEKNYKDAKSDLKEYNARKKQAELEGREFTEAPPEDPGPRPQHALWKGAEERFAPDLQTAMQLDEEGLKHHRVVRSEDYQGQIPQDTAEHLQQATQKIMKDGAPPHYPGANEARTFENHPAKGEGVGDILPTTDVEGNPITYTEMDFMAPQPKIGENGKVELKPNGKPETTRGDDRLIVGSNGSIYYSPDHYHTFILLVE
ncbi:DUF6531 domain-containing protein [Rothia sp. HMSC067H10]|uniref:DUF6531 domain-containing protein n=1 Tax=Rothia sp. HMSC067H10 TaxID=1739260 RepID=UPI0008A37638|nr:DUF6531 domain-containing protein [Rothia sp. HMSC067H10]OFR99114.1 hypothetical protein HMPREF2756_04620 [Rothia sp. HMSC067H10]